MLHALVLAALTLASPDLAPNAAIAPRFALAAHGCGGENAIPCLVWSGVPRGTRAFALTLHDPDAGHGAGWTHWIVVRIPPDARSDAGFARDGTVQGRNDFGTIGYGGPCPPRGDPPHRYVFTLYALDANLPLPADVTYASLRDAIRGHVLATATLTGRYGR